MATKRQTTMAKLQREQAVREKRVRKQQRKDERKALAALGTEANGEPHEEREAVDPTAD